MWGVSDCKDLPHALIVVAGPYAEAGAPLLTTGTFRLCSNLKYLVTVRCLRKR